jgi:hypothetical protein
MTRFLLVKDLSRFFRRALFVMAMAFGMAGAVGASAAVATTTGVNAPLTASITVLGCNPSGGGDVDISLQNNTRGGRPVAISVYRDHDGQVFGGDVTASPGTSVLAYRGLPPAKYTLVVGSHRQVLAVARADFRECPEVTVPGLSQQLVGLSQQ